MDDLSGHLGGLLWAFRFTEARAYPIQTLDDAVAPLADQDWRWLHFPLGDVRARALLAQIPELPGGFHALVEELEDRLQVHDEGRWTFGVLPDLERDLAGKPLGAGRLYFATDGEWLITARLHALRAVDDVRRQTEQGARLQSPVAAVAALLERFIEIVEARLEHLADRLDEVEDLVLDGPSDLDGPRLGPFRQELSRHRREFQALRNALIRTCSGRDGAKGRMAEALSPLIAPVNDLDREAADLQERARLLHEEIDTLITSATNRSMRALTVISTLLIPPTVVVGAFGMNLPGMPFANSRGGFALATGLCLAVVAAAWALLRRLRVLP